MFLNGDNIISASKHTAVSALLYTNHMVTSVTLERAKSIVEEEIDWQFKILGQYKALF